MFVSPPLGTLRPASVHGTVVCLPTLADVIAYERKEPATLAKITAGYPRFVRHHLVQQAAEQAARQQQRTGDLFPLVSAAIAEKLLVWAEARHYFLDAVSDWVLVSIKDADTAQRFAKLVQHTGALISSRQAEAYLKQSPIALQAELSEIQKTLQPYLAPVAATDIVVTNSGMNAVFTAMTAVNQVQRPRGKKAWIQLGWLYVDTVRLLEKAQDTKHYFLPDVKDLAAVEDILASGQVAGIVTEIPNNPQLETPDVAALRALCDRYDAKLILDPSVVGLASVDPLPWADIVVASLTKYAASQGDIMAGVIAVNPQRDTQGELQRIVKSHALPLYAGEVKALASQIGAMAVFTAQVSQTSAELVKRLAQHPGVARVRSADQGPTAGAYKRIQRAGAGAGSIITIELKVPMAPVYDKLRMIKGPSFGLTFSLAAPFLWLSHFENVTSEVGRAQLREIELDPDLLRLSVGLEPVEEIWAVLAEALKA